MPFVTLVAMVVDFSLSLSPCPLTLVRVISTGCSWPGVPIMTCILSRYVLLRLACFNRTLYRVPGTVLMSW